ncbi:response regulator with CheY-like receiver domain and winged-helix DNA-binding domain [Desulfosporosinus orientis DSM 765]|uniref:Stage 0 sporulation protein A homolog n=1 Tax=Desulfosporosinus orientis (strain ATCC 19365 / DSM 765 / NCIMB 8382 / VKM B-1628 / Singapore I) TaxID=768706 RepID=G7W724_DESOD|nr:response regulator transcription factor [Desulfosporosinus orientis]AET69881.1 response regulator with CheY-like receiver domain and winged-helix DNA-binding domain [Desulfosporosinus orientis DSM 765]
MNKPVVLIADDEDYIRKLVSTALDHENILVYQAKNGSEALEMIKRISFDLIILDIMMGDINGYDVISTIRSQGINIPVFLLSGKKEDYDKIIGFGIGADGYITKPFSPVVLCAQVKTQIKRYRELLDAKNQYFKIILDPFVFNLKTYTCYKNEIELPLSSKEALLMKFFMENPNQVFSKEQIYQNVWGDNIVDDNTIMVYIRHLRSKIEENPSKPEYLKTIWGIGYKLSVE